MIPQLGEVWMVDMGMVGKIRPTVVILDERLEIERSLIIHIPITSQNRGSALEVSLGHVRFLTPESVANIQGIGSLPTRRFERKLGTLSPQDMDNIRSAMKLAFRW